MRQIKFRGKNIHTGEWLYGDYHREGKTHYITKPEDLLREYAPIEFIVDEKTASQFTGLFDINGCEIYEDDIISMCLYCGKKRTEQGIVADLRKRGIGVVFYDTTLARWRVKLRTTVTNLVNKKEVNSIRFKILGNIHDNPSLLNTK